MSWSNFQVARKTEITTLFVLSSGETSVI